MIQFQYNGETRQALEIGADDRMIGCMFCFQVTPKIGHKSFKVHKMMDVVEISREPFASVLQDIDDTGFVGQRGGGKGACQDCSAVDQLNCDQKCPGCETAFVVMAS
jgi:hypothetical protein